MPSAAYATKEDEYWYNVSPQEGLPLAGQVDFDIDLESVSKFFLELSNTPDALSARNYVLERLIGNPVIFGYIRQFLGLSDKRAYLDLSYIASRTPHPTRDTTLSGCQPWTLTRHPMTFFLRLLGGSKGKQVQVAAAEMIATYLIDQGLLEAAKGFSNMSDQLTEMVYVRLISPKEYQQKAAKRRGHGCEAALAAVLEQCHVRLIPENKATNPMGASDPHINLETMSVSEREVGVTHAFDMVILKNGHVAVAIQSLIHTSDPGQYGVDKSNETVIIATQIREWREVHRSEPPVELWGLVDGVGFSENKSDTINKMLRNFDHFVQLRTLYKAPLRLHTLKLITVKGVRFSGYYDTEDIDAIRSLYVPDGVQVLANADEIPPDWRSLPCGEALVYL
jgi:hypothetical protein